MTKTKGVLYGLGIIGILFAGWRLLREHESHTDAQTVSQMLPAGDKAKVIVNQQAHTYTTVSRDAETGQAISSTKFLARTASIETKPDGTVVVTSRSWGTELSPWVGVSLDSEIRARGALGLNVFYWQRYEIGGGVSMRFKDADARGFVGASYNVYGNILLTAAIDNHKAIYVGVGLRF